MDDAVFTMLHDKYRVGKTYISAYLKQILGTDSIDEEEFQQKLSNNANLANWLDYALSTNLRGRAFVEILRPHIGPQARRYLDVGSAYGGFLVGFLEQGLEVVGLEYNEAWVALCNANLQESGVKGTWKVITGSILDKDLAEQIGKFDVITCIDVIEHVSDVPLAMQNMVQLLNPGGIIVLQLPNKDSVSNIISDSHFGLFAITLLKHRDAEQFFFHHFPNNKIYDVGEYYCLNYYLDSLRGLGCKATVLPSVLQSKTSEKLKLVPRYVGRLVRFVFLQTNIPPILRIKVVSCAIIHLISFLLQLGIVFFVRKRLDTFKSEFIDDAWLILGTKSFE